MPLEHINICVPYPHDSAMILCELFDWHIRWEGGAIDDGHSVHVGDKSSYLALYAPKSELSPEAARYAHVAGLNHIGVVVEDIKAVETSVKAAGYTPYSHASYEPGERFYFEGPDGIEFEVVSYA